MNKHAEKRCKICAKPITLKMEFCREHWSKIPADMRDAITKAFQDKNFFARATAVKQALDWFDEKRRFG